MADQPTLEDTAKAERDREVAETLANPPPELVWETQELAIKIEEFEARERAKARGLPGTGQREPASQP